MGILLFMIDTSASMAVKTYLGTSYLDVAKAAVETFMKYRMRDPASRSDRYMLVTFDEPPYSVKSGWKENHATFVAELKTLQATGLSTFSASVREAFKLLNIHRLHTGIETYGQGRNPFYLEPAVIICITDGHLMTNNEGIETELVLQDGQQTEGSELTREVYRWDQRLFSVVLRLPGTGGPSANPKDPLPTELALAKLAEATGGKSYVVSSQRSINQCMESLIQKLHPGVVIHFQKLPVSLAVPNKLQVQQSQLGRASPTPMETEQTNSTDPVKMDTGHLSGIAHFNHLKADDTGRDTPPPLSYTQQQPKTTWEDTKKMIYIKTSPKGVLTGHWPIPESFWPDISMQTLIPRDAHPVVWFDTTEVNPLFIANFPFDKYELEPSLLTQHILEKRNSSTCWQVYIENSGSTSGFQYPFGYLKASSNLTAVNLFIMPYNYPKIIPLIDELGQLPRDRMWPPSSWRAEFADYLTCLPCYYIQPLRNALRSVGAPPSLIPDGYDGQLSYTIQTYLRKLKKQAKIDSDRYISSVKHKPVSDKPKTIELGQDIISIAIGAPTPKEDVLDCKSPFEISRIRLLQQLSLMRARFLKLSAKTRNTVMDEVNRHELPIGQMGNYQEHLKKINPLREVDSGLVRTQLFGNPFKLEKPDKRAELGDVADEHMVEQMSRSRSNRSGRRSFRGTTPPPPPKQEVLTSQKINNTTDEKDSLAVFEPVKENSLVVEEESLISSEDESTLINSHSVESKEIVTRKRPPSPSIPVPIATKKSLSDSITSEEVSVEDESKLNSKLIINKPPGATTTVPGTGQFHHSQPPVRSLSMPPPKLESSASKVLTEELQKQLGQENSKLRLLIIKEVRRPGKNFEVIFQHLDNVKGSITIRKNFVMDIIKEAKRFKKKPLIEKLEEWAEQLESKKLSSPSPTPTGNKKKDANNKMATQRLSESGNNNSNRESSWKR